MFFNGPILLNFSLIFSFLLFGTNVVSHGGTVAPGVPVQLIFWGNNWNTGNAGLRDQLVAAAHNLIDGPFTSALGQYGLKRPYLPSNNHDQLAGAASEL